MRNRAERLSVPACTASPRCTGTGRASPVSSDVSRSDWPAVITPSAGMVSPARTSTSIPGRSVSMGTSRVASPSTRRALAGASAASISVASAALRCCRRCRYRPTRSRKTSVQRVSKYTWPAPRTVLTAPWTSPAARPKAMGTSMCRVRVRRAAPGPAEEDGSAAEDGGERRGAGSSSGTAPRTPAPSRAGSSVESEGDGHDVAGDGPGDADAQEKRTILPARALRGGHTAKRVGRVAEAVQAAGDGGERRSPPGPRPREPRARGRSRETDTSPGCRRGSSLHEPDAGRAVDALQEEVGAAQAVRGGGAGTGLERRVVELGVALPGPARGLGVGAPASRSA
jgi:hypothetical protein